MRKGFTLIELLVVVLIIGILAAVAVPKYQKAVTKARAAEAKTLMRSVITAEEAFFMANGVYTNCLNELDIDVIKGFSVVSETGGCITGVSKGSGSGRIYLEAARNPRDWWFTAWVGSKMYSGSGGFAAYFGSIVRPLSCAEHACHAVTEGSFCREIMGIKTPPELIGCERLYKE